MNVVWHDLECGSYDVDIPLWRRLADQEGDPILDVGAGTGRITLELARRGHRVTALDIDGELLGELKRRGAEQQVDTVCADARAFDLGARRYALCVVPMQTIQLLGGSESRLRFLRCVQRHLSPGALLAVAISESLELYEELDGVPSPLPDICELDGVVYSSQPTAVRAENGTFVIERRRDVIAADGARSTSDDRIRLDRLTVEQLEQEGASVGLRTAGTEIVPATEDYVGSEVVMFRA